MLGLLLLPLLTVPPMIAGHKSYTLQTGENFELPEHFKFEGALVIRDESDEQVTLIMLI